MDLCLTVNGQPISLAEVPGEASLLEVLRGRLGLLGTKEGCGVGECGACTVLLDGRALNSCLTAAWQAAGRQVTTIEGLAQGGHLHPLQRAFVETGAVQCGFCTPGMILAAWDLLQRNDHPSDQEIKQALAGNLCRCTGYHDILRAVRRAARWLREGAP
ncbi:MAG: (2Fe-2S)-binding protein [Desulfarculus sp.]|nr:MAG: (2Fe-2S)-binding protein [Desulfarculus sp.]